MKTDKIIAGNRLLAEFMTGQKPESTVFFGLNCTASELKYHSSWDWLMPVVEKIEETNDGETIVTISSDNCLIVFGKKFSRYVAGYSKIESVWLACVEFVKWWNEEQK